mgnify:CR=1 FL=1
MYSLLKSLFFLLSPEKAHYFATTWLERFHNLGLLNSPLAPSFKVEDKKLERKLFGLTFPNPVGLAAGFDKDAKWIDSLAELGFGFIEIGTVTPVGQPGNPKPRLFRLVEDEALINRMGFNNAGLQAAIKQLKKNKKQIVIGGNIGKNTLTAPEDYTNDYLECFKALHPHVDYFVLNVSCPNVGSHAKLNDKDYLEELINAIQSLNSTFEVSKPILLKISPDLNNAQLDEIIELVKTTKIEGVIASNTSVSRENLKVDAITLKSIGNGGVSGQPISSKSTQVIKYLSDNSQKAFPIIGVGGIHSEKDALDKLSAGADLVQIYTGFIYEGPALVKRINKAVLKSSLNS